MAFQGSKGGNLNGSIGWSYHDPLRGRHERLRRGRCEGEGVRQGVRDVDKALYALQRQNVSGEESKKIADDIAATRRLAEAQLHGAEATRKAALKTKYAHMADEGVKPEVIAEARRGDALKHAQEVTAEALKTGIAHKTQLESIGQQIVKLQDLQAEGKGTVAIAISLRDLENQRLKTLVEQALAMRSPKDGLRAFFLEMQTDAKSAAAVVYESLK
jgi:hypothetical protein